jgi:hydrogenase maturation protein HypF
VSGPPSRLRLVCRGTVQGVGFRPAVHRLATGLGLSGWVRNGPEGVVVEVEGEDAAVTAFARRLPGSLPPLARLDDLEVAAVEPAGDRGFSVMASEDGARARALVPPDTALCSECRREMADPADRRFRYPFTTCTDCGPRFSLVQGFPYDRVRTSMACFALCPACRREYEDPGDRRFHAEPVCCPECGPRVWVEGPGTGDRGPGSGTEEKGSGVRGPGSGTEGKGTGVRGPGSGTEGKGTGDQGPGSGTTEKETGAEAIGEARRALEGGAIVAVKGLGGFQLACRADDDGAVARLRDRKRRPAKPFAVMVADLEAARRLVTLTLDDEELLGSPRSPVVLAPRRPDAPVCRGIAPGLDDLGVLLPTTPLHVELFRDARWPALVMTSGNLTDEPICKGNREALERLSGIADLFLVHDRDVVRRVDDSVVRSTPTGPVVLRRARGYVPDPLPLPVAAPRPVLAMGPYLQATACLAAGGDAFFSQHVGDLDSEPARAFLAEAVEGLEAFLDARAEVIVVDHHPDYASTRLGERLAEERGARLVRVQHHVAHAAAVLAEHRRFPAPGGQALAVALDGTGWGGDGSAWGGEWLLLGGDLSWRRLAHLEPLPLVGGEAAVREPWRVVVAALLRAGAGDLLGDLPMAAQVAVETLRTVARLAARPGWPLASGAGRVFEAGGALLGLAAVNGYEGEAAARLEALAASAWPAEPWHELVSGPRVPDPGPLPSSALLAVAARRLLAGEPPARIAAGFHATFCRLVARWTSSVAPDGTTAVAIGGGCLVNRLLREALVTELTMLGLDTLLPSQVPPGDGGIAYGQAVLGVVGESLGGS